MIKRGQSIPDRVLCESAWPQSCRSTGDERFMIGAFFCFLRHHLRVWLPQEGNSISFLAQPIYFRRCY